MFDIGEDIDVESDLSGGRKVAETQRKEKRKNQTPAVRTGGKNTNKRRKPITGNTSMCV
jgi:hypothetical protein